MAAHFRRLDLGSKELEEGWSDLIGSLGMNRVHIVFMKSRLFSLLFGVARPQFVYSGMHSSLISAPFRIDLEMCLLRAPALLQSMLELAANAYAIIHSDLTLLHTPLQTSMSSCQDSMWCVCFDC